MTEALIDINEIQLTPEQLNEHAAGEKLNLKPISRSQLLKLVNAGDLTDRVKTGLTKSPVMELTARHPYDAAGFIDVYKPGRWDCESNLVYMDVIRSTGPSPGMWEGTVGYARFKAPKAGDYLIVLNFSGHQITMKMSGPWGVSTAFNATNTTSSAVTALWHATKGQQVFFNLSCTGPIIGYFKSIQVFLL